jgi:flagellar biosynthesis chaperone FliJ
MRLILGLLIILSLLIIYRNRVVENLDNPDCSLVDLYSKISNMSIKINDLENTIEKNNNDFLLFKKKVDDYHQSIEDGISEDFM